MELIVYSNSELVVVVAEAPSLLFFSMTLNVRMYLRFIDVSS